MVLKRRLVFIFALAWLSLAVGDQAPATAADVKSAGAMPVGNLQMLHWQSRNQSLNDLTEEFNTLYEALRELKKVGWRSSTKTVKDPSSETPADVLKKEGLYSHQGVPLQLDLLVCELNPQKCSIIERADDGDGDSGKRAKWSYVRGDPLTIPNLKMKQSIVLRSYQKKPGDRIESIVVKDRQGCKNFDERCARLVRNLNRLQPKALEKSFRGKITVPTRAYRADILLENVQPPTSHTGGAISAVGSWNIKQFDIYKDINKSALKKFNSRVIPKLISGELQSTTQASDLTGSRSLVLSLINHPFTLGEEIPQSRPPVSVGVLDLWVDPSHCDFHNQIIVNNTTKRPAGAKPKTQCGTRAKSRKARDHGTHVVGIIGAKRQARSGPGVNPKACIYTMEMYAGQLINPRYSLDLYGRLVNSQGDRCAPEIFNLSFQYFDDRRTGGNDVISNFIREQQNNILFVVAAGNGGRRIASTDPCPINPACFSVENVISVVAVDLSRDAPDRMDTNDGTSNSGDKFDIAAPGLAIESTIANNKIGVMSGTSQATPLVAGAASLILAKVRQTSKEHFISPGLIKNRLIYTADFIDSLHSIVKGGRLNISRAIDFTQPNEDVVIYRDNNGVSVKLRGLLLKGEKIIYFTNIETGREFARNYRQLRRLIWNASNQSYTLVDLTDDWYPRSPVRKAIVTLRHEDRQMKFAARVSGQRHRRIVTFRVDQIQDYIAALKRDPNW